MKKLYFILFLILSVTTFSQTKVKDTVTRRATIGYDKKGNQVSLRPETPPLVQVAGAPKASYSYFWETGDGSYSREPNPKHTYKKKGEYKVNLSVTNNYDNGKPPKTRPKLVAINEITDTNYTDIASLNDTTAYTIFKNREPVPDEEIIIVVSYKNPLDYVANGKLYLFYNDKEFKNDNFELVEYRTHFGEKEVVEDGIACADELNNDNPFLASVEDDFITNHKVLKNDENLDMTLLESKSLFRKVTVLEFDGMNPNETRNAFFTFKTTPEMIKDTSATVRMRGVYVPDRNYKNHKKKTLEMEIVTSHDPNKMSSNAMFMNYRTVRFKTINFKTRFQNDGEGPAKMIRLETDIPDMFDKKTLKIVDSYPKCPICPKDEEVTYSCLDTIIKQKQIHFTFKNIYIPGSTQKNVTEKDSTKGFVKYSMKFAKDFHKIKTKSKTAIIFDKNEPVITNYATTRFLPGISIGLRSGYNFYDKKETVNSNVDNPKTERPKSYFVGATISPYKSYRFYWQAELYYSRFESSGNSGLGAYKFEQLDEPYLTNNGTVIDIAFNQESTTSTISKNTLEVVPVSLRYNVNNFIGLGVGPQISLLMSQKTETNTTKKFYEPIFDATLPPVPGNEIVPLQSNSTTTTRSKTFEKTQASVFADMTLGIARIGPSVGLRYYLNFEKNANYWQVYAIWKF